MTLPTRFFARRSIALRGIASAAFAGVCLGSASLAAWPQVAGTTTIGVAVTQITQVAVGWSAKKQILGQTVYNQDDEKVGKVVDLIVTPDSAVSFAIVGAGGFVGLRRHEVAIPVEQFAPHAGGGFVLAGATKEIVKALPKFEYAKPDDAAKAKAAPKADDKAAAGRT